MDWSHIRICEKNKILSGELGILMLVYLRFMSCPLGMYSLINTPTNSTKVKTLLGLHCGINYFSSAICPLETSSPKCSHYSDTESWTPNGPHVYTELERGHTV